MLELKFQNQLGMTSEIPQFEMSSQPTPFWVRNRPGNVGPNLQEAKIVKVETGEPSTSPICSLSRHMWLWGWERGWALLRLDWVVHCYGPMLSVFLLKTPDISWLRRPFDSSFWSLLFWVLYFYLVMFDCEFYYLCIWCVIIYLHSISLYYFFTILFAIFSRYGIVISFLIFAWNIFVDFL